MYYILAVLFYFSAPSVDENHRVEVVQSKEGYYYTVMTTERESTKDTLKGYSFPIEVQDFLYSNKKEISLILETHYGKITYENYNYDNYKKRYICIDKYPIGKNEISRGALWGDENINPRFKIVGVNNVAKVDESGDQLYVVDLDRIKAAGFSRHKIVVDK